MKKNKYKERNMFLLTIFTITILLSATIIFSADDCVTIPYPSGRFGHDMVYDPVNDLIIVYGGGDRPGGAYLRYTTLAYDYNNNNWTDLDPSGSPAESSWGAMAYDSESAKIIHFGGGYIHAYRTNETWIYDFTTNTWTKAEPNLVPNLRSAQVMAYDSESDVVIMHGGAADEEGNPEGEYLHFNDTWAFDVNTDTWTNMTPTGLDVGLCESQMTYDSESDRIIMFGGYFVEPYGDPQDEYYSTAVWAYDYNTNTWENISTTIHPKPRIDHSLSYDTESDRVILVGGHKIQGDLDLRNETWAFDYNTLTWENMNPIDPPLRLAHQTAYDAESDLIVLFGGAPDVTFEYASNKIYTYDYNSNNWTLMPSDLCETPISLVPIVTSFSILAILVILKRKKHSLLSSCFRKYKK